jgi:hypothetical protein
MFILDKPYVSQFLLNTIARLNLPVLQNQMARSLPLPPGVQQLATTEAAARQKQLPYPLVYCNSENSLNWLKNHLDFCDLPQKIDLCKDKVKFRELLKPLYPHFFFAAVRYDDLPALDITACPLPFIIKPAVGFFSMGVYRVDTPADWPGTVAQIQQEMARIAGLYPVEVMDARTFIIESVIEGPEFAIDAYFNHAGQPVILNILEHVFCSNHDVSDRVYLTSSQIMRQRYRQFYDVLVQMGQLAGLRNFPMHLEVRVDSQNRCLPIEANPMRFAGWCTTDIAWYAYGINVYETYFGQKEPAWNAILESRPDDYHAIIVADVPKSINPAQITAIDYDRFLQNFSAPHEVRRIDYRQYPVFAFLLAKIAHANAAEIDKILKLDFADYIVSE